MSKLFAVTFKVLYSVHWPSHHWPHTGMAQPNGYVRLSPSYLHKVIYYRLQRISFRVWSKLLLGKRLLCTHLLLYSLSLRSTPARARWWNLSRTIYTLGHSVSPSPRWTLNVFEICWMGFPKWAILLISFNVRFARRRCCCLLILLKRVRTMFKCSERKKTAERWTTVLRDRHSPSGKAAKKYISHFSPKSKSELNLSCDFIFAMNRIRRQERQKKKMNAIY